MSRLEARLETVVAMGWSPWLIYEDAHKRWSCEAIPYTGAPQAARVYGELQTTPAEAVESCLTALRADPARVAWGDLSKALAENIHARQ